MAKSAKSRRRLLSRKYRPTPYPTPQPYCWDARAEFNMKRTSVLKRKDWEEATCSVCMESPHNAVLLLCSSHDKGCRPYMCGTSQLHSNCLEQFNKAYTKVRSTEFDSLEGNPIRLGLTASRWSLELSCPLCRGQVKGWTVVESARKYLDNNKRSCIQDDCSFVGAYKELKKHVKSDHPFAKPQEIDPEMEEKWRVLQIESERQDVMSTIMSTMPRSIVLGDYVIDMTNGDGIPGADEDDETGGEEPSLLNRNILYVLREGARLMRNFWEDTSLDVVDGVAGDGGAVIARSQGGGANASRADRPNRRQRRQRRSRGPSPFNAS